MNTKKLNMITSMVSLVLVFVLMITVIYAWYTNNKNVSSNGLQATTSSDQIKITQSILFNEKEEGVILPENEESKHIGGLIDGSYFYYGLQVECVAASIDGNLSIQIGEIIGGDFFLYDDDTITAYNMCDIYQIGLNEVWLNDTKETLTEDQQAFLKFNHSATEQNIYHFSLLGDYQWTAVQGDTITFIFQIKMDINAGVPLKENDKTIGRNQMGRRTLNLNNILVLYS